MINWIANVFSPTRPKDMGETVDIDQNQNQNQGPVREGGYVLSADASPFQSKFTMGPQTGTLSIDAPVFQPRYNQPVDIQEQLNEEFQRLATIRPTHLRVTTAGNSARESASDMFKDAVFHLTTAPGKMEEYLKPVVDTLKRGVTEMAVLDDIIDTLFEQCISEPNFHFTGAKVSVYLSDELKSHHVFNKFKGNFLKRCGEENHKRAELLATNVERLCGLSMFIGELFLVMKIETDEGTVPFKGLRKAIMELELTLLSRPDDITVKCATQLLKMTGPAIVESANLPGDIGDFSDVFNTIKSLEKHPSLNKTSHCLINSVLSRLKDNFGVGIQASPPRPNAPSYTHNYDMNFDVGEPVFYNSKGQPITREEAGFGLSDVGEFEGLNAEESEAYLQWEAENYMASNQWNEQLGGGAGYGAQPWSTGGYQAWSNPDDAGYPYLEEEYQDTQYSDDMNDEMLAAYEDFLRESGQGPP